MWRRGYDLDQSGDRVHTGYNPRPTNQSELRHPQQWVMTQLRMNHNLSYEGSNFQPILIVTTYHVKLPMSSPPAT